MKLPETYTYLADQSPDENDNPVISIKDEISSMEVDNLFSSLSISSIYHGITQIKDIVVQNGKNLQDYTLAENLNLLRTKRIDRDKIILNANRLVLNYATSIKTYIDMETRILSRKNKNNELQLFKKLCSKFYDAHSEYRFWMNFRNYVVHCDFPYHGFNESFDKGYELICAKEHLLEFDNWKHSKKDILGMKDNICLSDMVIEMSSMIMALYLDFFAYFSQEIAQSITCYSTFCKKYDVKAPAFLVTQQRITKENQLDVMKGSKLQPLPIKNLYRAFDVLKDNPNVHINYKDT